jgi:predicted tellurium resistance membrane protein TerC
MLQQVFDFGAIVLADLVLSGDNALIIGMAAASLSPELRKRAILFGIIVAAALRIIFALVATRLLGVPGLLFSGVAAALLGLLAPVWRNPRQHRPRGGQGCSRPPSTSTRATPDPRESRLVRRCSRSPSPICRCRSTMFSPLPPSPTATTEMLVFGLGLAILLMAFAATLIMKILTRFPAISWLGLAVLLYVASRHVLPWHH